MTPEALQPDEWGALEEAIDKIDALRDATVYGQLILQASLLFNRNPLPDIEKILRSNESDTYLIARPIYEQTEYESKLPLQDKEKLYDYYVWVEVNGKEEADKILRELEIDAEENEALLHETGLLVFKENSPLGRKVNAPWN